MSGTNDQILLTNFFGAYFHEDFLCDAGSPSDVVALDVKEPRVTLEHLRKLNNAILDYSRRCNTDAELEEKLFSELGCYYRPSVEGLTARTWLQSIASKLLEGGNQRGNQ